MLGLRHGARRIRRQAAEAVLQEVGEIEAPDRRPAVAAELEQRGRRGEIRRLGVGQRLRLLAATRRRPEPARPGIQLDAPGGVGFDAVVIGVRAFNDREDLAANLDPKGKRPAPAPKPAAAPAAKP